jgi:surfeit locus 1 family protein
MMNYLRELFSRKWLPLIVISLGAMALFIRLGIWQLDRLEQRRVFNERVLSQINLPVLKLDMNTYHEDLYQMEYRKVEVVGHYNFQDEIAIRNQAYENRPGVHLVTPLIISGTEQAILVDRGWIPDEDFRSGDWSAYAEPGEVTVEGILRRTQSKPDFGSRTDPTPAPGEERKTAWFFVNVEGIQHQIPYSLLKGAYIQQSADAERVSLPIPTASEVEISEGPHLSYAIQWFIFALIAFLAVPILVFRQVSGRRKLSRPGEAQVNVMT